MYKIIGADQKEYGPITADQLRQWIVEGRVNGNTKVQMEGIEGWKTVSELPEFAAGLPVNPPPSPRVPVPVAMAPAAPRTNQTSVWALITGIIAFVPCCWWITGPIAIILGCIALSQIKKNPQQTGSGMAIAGIVLGIISLLLYAIGAVVMMSTPGFMDNLRNSLNQ